MDIQSKADEIGISVDAYKRLCSLFINNTDKDLDLLSTAITSNDIQIISDTAHHIKGAASNMEFETMADLAKELQLLAQGQKKSDNSLLDHYNKLLREYQSKKTEIEAHL